MHGSEADAPYLHLIPGGGGGLCLLDHLRIARQITLHSEGRGKGEIHTNHQAPSPPMAVCNGSAWSAAALAEAGNAIQHHSHSSSSNLPAHQQSQDSTASPHASSLPAAVSHTLAPTSNPHGAQQLGIHMIPSPTQTSCYIEAQVNAFIPQRDITRGQVSFSEDRGLGAQNTTIIMHDHFRVQEKTGSSRSATYTYTYSHAYVCISIQTAL